MASSSENISEVALISMPWSIFNRPSIQLGSLKAYTEHFSDTKVTCFHPYLQVAKTIGIDNYTTISGNGWAGEAIFSALLFQQMGEKSQAVFKDALGKKGKELPSFDALKNFTDDSCTAWCESIDWSRFIAVGFTLCFNQLLASLYMAEKLKKIPDCPPIIFGGSSCAGTLGSTILEQFRQIDYIIDGEGETPFTSLCSYLKNNARGFPERVFCRQQLHRKQPSPEIADLNDLPIPNYAPYFLQMKEVFPQKPFIPELPIEFSRGCWWNKCSFCNLNLQWKGYRSKKSNRMFKEITTLACQHQCLDFNFTDNALPTKEAALLVKQLQTCPSDYHFFAEIRATTPSRTLRKYKQIGINSVQVGIEALSPTLLEKMGKGVAVIENIAAMKHAMAENISLDGNLIIEFPGSTEQEVLETLHTLNFILPFKPLKTAVFFLGFGSPVHKAPADYGISGILKHQKIKALFPQCHLNNLDFLVNDYRGDRVLQRKLWQPVIKKVAEWNDFHNKRKNRQIKPLTFRDGMEFIIIRQEQSALDTLRHRLQGASREIYLFCIEIRTIDEIIKQFRDIKKQVILNFINQLCTKRLMFRERDKILSLAIPQ